MRVLSAAKVLLVPGSLAFVPSALHVRHGAGVRWCSRTSLHASFYMADDDERNQSLTARFFSARAKQAGAPVVEKEPELPKFFEDDMLKDMQTALLKLQKRVKEGPGALTAEEVEEFAASSERILVDIKSSVAHGGVVDVNHVPVEQPVVSDAEQPPPQYKPPPQHVRFSQQGYPQQQQHEDPQQEQFRRGRYWQNEPPPPQQGGMRRGRYQPPPPPPGGYGRGGYSQNQPPPPPQGGFRGRPPPYRPM